MHGEGLPKLGRGVGQCANALRERGGLRAAGTPDLEQGMKKQDVCTAVGMCYSIVQQTSVCVEAGLPVLGDMIV